MKLANVALGSAVVLSIFAVGCTAKTADDSQGDGTLGSAEQTELVNDDTESSDTDNDLESGIDQPLSGARLEDPESQAEGATVQELIEKVRANAGLFFKPAGCITSTANGNVVTHVFNNCTGPWGMAKFNGTITSTYVLEGGKLTITHEATGFTVNGATITGKRIIVYTRNGAVITKTRTGDFSGTTAKGKAITHEASFVTTYDSSAKCITRDGSAQTSIGGRSFERSIDNYKRCGIGRLGCPESGQIVLSRTKNSGSLSLTIDFLGGRQIRITEPNGTQVTRLLVCNPNAG